MAETGCYVLNRGDNFPKFLSLPYGESVAQSALHISGDVLDLLFVLFYRSAAHRPDL